MSDAENGPGDSRAEGAGEPGDKPGADAAHVDDYVRRLRPSPESPPQRVVVLSGLLGDSDRSGWRRLYLSRDLTRYVEFRDEDLIYREAVPAEQAPMRGWESSRVGVKRGARIDFIVSRQGVPVDEFDLDLRVGRRRRPGAAAMPILPPDTEGADCPGDSFFVDCETDFGCHHDTRLTCGCEFTDVTCRTLCDQATCDTCQTRCGQRTCATCGQATCATCAGATCQATQCDQPTCATCQTQCGQVTCATCRTQCDQATCDCMTNNPHVFTCGPQCG